MRIADAVGETLRIANFDLLRPSDRPSHLYFEDGTLMGLFVEFPNVDALLTQWRNEQDEFLAANAEKIRSSASKAWNLYCVFMTSDEAADAHALDIAAVEEDFRGTRKIVGAGVISRADVVQTLLPILPIQNLLEIAETDVRKDLRDRLTLSEPVKAALFDGVPTRELVELFLEES